MKTDALMQYGLEQLAYITARAHLNTLVESQAWFVREYPEVPGVEIRAEQRYPLEAANTALNVAIEDLLTWGFKHPKHLEYCKLLNVNPVYFIDAWIERRLDHETLDFLIETFMYF